MAKVLPIQDLGLSRLSGFVHIGIRSSAYPILNAKRPCPLISFCELSHRVGRNRCASSPQISGSVWRTLTGMTTSVPLGMTSWCDLVSVKEERGIATVSAAFSQLAEKLEQ